MIRLDSIVLIDEPEYAEILLKTLKSQENLHVKQPSHAETIAKRKREWFLNNKERMYEINKKYGIKHSKTEKAKATRAAWRKANEEKLRLYHQEYYQKRKEAKKMKIKSLSIKNFLVISEVDLDIEDAGLMLIQGENLSDTSASSNGSGKTSILESISWCLYGTTAKGITGDAVINNIAKKDCLVKLVIKDGDLEYVISRGRKSSLIKNSVTVFEGTKDLTCGTDKLTQEVIDKIVGCNEEIFNNSIYAAQEKMPCLSSMTDKQLKLLVEDAAGINSLQAAQTVAESRLKTKQYELSTVGSEIVIQKEKIAGLEFDIERIEAAKKKHFDELQAEGLSVKELHAESRKKYNDLKEAMAEMGYNEGSESSPSAIDAELKKIGIELLSVKSQKISFDGLDRKVRGIDTELVGLRKEERKLKESITSDKTSFDNISDKVGVPCRSCGKETKEEDLAEIKSIAKTNLIAAIEKCRTFKPRIESLEEELSLAITDRKNFADTMTDISESVTRQGVLMGILKRSQDAHLQLEKIDAESSRLTDRFNGIKAKIADKSVFVDETNLKESMIKEAKEKLTQFEAKEILVENSIEIGKLAVKVFGRAGVRAEILDSCTPILNEKTAEYLDVLSDGKITASWSTLTKNAKGELVEKFSIDVSKDGGADKFLGLSGGEKRKVRLATVLALQDLVALRASKPIEFRFFDEIDGGLDDAGIERLFEMLKEKAKTVGTMLVISHRNHSETIDNVVTVINEGGKGAKLG